MKRLGILGTFVWDTVWTLEDQAAGRPFETWGGMGYSLAAGAAALPAGWEIAPIAHVGADLAGRAHGFLDTLPGIGRRGGIVAVEQANNRVELVYTSASERGERMSGGVPGWTWEELAPHLDGLDALYVNFFSGWELDLATATRLRELPIPVYADLHSLFLGPPRADGPRLYRRLPESDAWLGCFRMVQLNEVEYNLLLGAPFPGDRYPHRLLHFGPEAAFVTLGPSGIAYAVRAGAGRTRGDCVAPPSVVCDGDPTGAGDSWGVTAFAGLLAGLPVADAVRRACALAAAKLSHRGASGLYEHLDRFRPAWDVPPHPSAA